MKTMRIALLLALALTVAAASGVLSYSGNLSSPVGSGIDGTGFWINPGVSTIEWAVTPGAGYWNYYYKMVVPQAAISHLIIETSPNFTSNDIWDINFLQGSYQMMEIKDHLASNPGNPFLPGDVYGIKFNDTTGTTIEFSFKSSRVPVWGDFYAKCGAVGGTQNTAWNAGFLAADPAVAPHDGSEAFHILVPDTVVPEPGSMLALGAGLVGLLIRRRRA